MVRSSVIRFGDWELHADSGELLKGERRIRLQDHPLRALLMLLERPGELVTREQLIGRLWPKSVVDFEAGLNTAMRKLRAALGDEADTPRYIETIPRRGYRLIANVELSDEPQIDARSALPATPDSQPAAGQNDRTDAGRFRLARRVVVFVAVAVALLMAWDVYRNVTTEIAPAARASIAVLPFQSLSSSPDDEFLGAGIAEMVLHRLAGIGELTVIARTSSFAFQNSRLDAREIGRKLNADHLIEGTVQRSGRKLRITAQLIDTRSGQHVWSLSFDREDDNLFAVQDAIARRVAEELSVSLMAAKPARNLDSAIPVEAYLEDWRGRRLAATYKVEETAKAITHFQRALQLAPAFATASLDLADAKLRLRWLRNEDEKSESAIREILPLIDRALSLDPRLGDAYALRARFSGDPREAEADYLKALSLAPNSAQAHEQYAQFLWGSLGRIDDAVASMEKAARLDPLSARIRHLYGTYLLLSDCNLERGRQELLAALSIDPDFHPSLARLARVEQVRGNFAEAAKLVERALAIEPQRDWMRVTAVSIYLDLNDLVTARSISNGSHGTIASGAIEIALHERDLETAAALAYSALERTTELETLTASASAAIRDHALVHGDFEPATRALQAWIDRNRLADGSTPDLLLDDEIILAQLLNAGGDASRAQSLLHGALSKFAKTQSHNYTARAAALAALGDTEAAIDELVSAEGVTPILASWWYIFEGDPTFAPLRSDARFQAMHARASSNAATQRALLEEMRSRGELPNRSSAER